MPECKARRELYQYVADGEPDVPAYRNLRGHLAACAQCREAVERLRAVEAGLRTMPTAVPPVVLTPAIMREVHASGRPAREDWQLFSWEVWVPVVAFAVALLIAMMSMPSHLFTSMTVAELEGALRQMPSNGSGWLAPLDQLTRSDIFWVVWTSLFVTTAGLGLGLSLKHLNRAAREYVTELQGWLSDSASRLLGRTRDAH
ncbi:MAG: hypothetical protein GX557_03535 [Chloroflexi bacterium]|nr:hypothetical protein [Chloroflexota bacterium]